MPNWTDSKKIKQIVLRKWEKGDILRSAFQKDELFPLRIKLFSPTSAEISQNFSEVIAWIAQLKKQEKAVLGYGYTIVEKEYHHRVCGKNKIPMHVEFETPDDAIRWIGKQEDFQSFSRNAQVLLCEWASLYNWVLSNPFQVIRMDNHCTAFAAVLRWFVQHQNLANVCQALFYHVQRKKGTQNRPTRLRAEKM